MVLIRKFLLCLPAELKETIQQEARKKGVSQNSLIVMILWQHFKKAVRATKVPPNGRAVNVSESDTQRKESVQ